jgi:RuvB-like protein 1 (pontin 52)
MLRIVGLRARAEGLSISEEGLRKLAEVATTSSLRYAVQLLTPAAISAVAHGSDTIQPEHISDTATLFLDTKRSAQLLLNYTQ